MAFRNPTRQREHGFGVPTERKVPEDRLAKAVAEAVQDRVCAFIQPVRTFLVHGNVVAYQTCLGNRAISESNANQPLFRTRKRTVAVSTKPQSLVLRYYPLPNKPSVLTPRENTLPLR